MADTIERTIYKLEIDDAGYIKGIDSLSASTKKLTDEQERANKALKTNEAALKANAEFLQKSKKDLDDYAGTNERYRKQLEKTFKSAEAEQLKIAQLVSDNKKQYDAASKAAQDFANIAARASQLQSQTTGGKIPTAPPPGLSSPVSNISGLADAIPQTASEFTQLAVAIATAEDHLKSLDQESEEFKQLAPIVAQGKIALQQYDAAAAQADGSTLSLKSQLRQAKEELVRLEQSGQGASKAYFELEKRTAKLTDQFADQQQRIRILASDTKLLDFGKGAITAATSAFQTYASVSILAGDESQELQKKTMQLFAAMQLLQSLEQLSNLTRREGVLATLAQSGAQTIYTAVVGASTGALKAFRIALFSTGILAAVAAIGFLVSKYNEMTEAAEEAGAAQKLINEVQKKAIEGYSSEVSKLDILKSKLNDLSIPQSKRIQAAKDYNKTAEESNKIDLKQIDNIDAVNASIDRQIQKLKQRAIARAAEAVISEKAESLFKAQVELEEQFPSFSNKAISDLEKNAQRIIDARKKALGIDAKVDTNEILSFADIPVDQLQSLAKNNKQFEILLDQQTRTKLKFIADQKKSIDQARSGERLSGTGVSGAQAIVTTAQRDLDRALQAVGGLIDINDLFGDGKPATDSKGKDIENVFIKTLRELLTRLRAASKEEFQSVDLIQQDFTDKLFSEIDKIDELVSKKQLTAKQGNILTKILEKIIGKEADKSIADFKKKVEAAINKLQDELNDIQNKANIDSINLLQDEFDRRAKLIDANEKIELDNAKEATEDRLAALDLDRLLIGEQAYQEAKAIIIATGEQNALNITANFGQQRQDLAADIFKKSLDNINKAFEEQILQVDEITAEKIQSEKALFNAGTISYEDYQKRITKILKDQKDARDKLRLQELTTELNAINKRLETATSADEKEDLQNRQRAVRNQIAELNSQTGVDDPNEKKKDTLQDYVSAVAQLSDSIVAFWQKANEAESAALDRSISLQEKRVEAATRIAARGNAEYLKQEEDRLKELEIKRENAARRQLAIDAALQASQVLVAITGAISKIATPGVGIAEVIGSIAVIVGALATGYGIVKSLQGNQPKLAKGDPYVKRGNNPAGVDTIPAWLNEGEAVTSAEKNKAYHPVIRAIHDGTIPADQLNNFVKTYHKIKSVPQVDYGRIEGVAQLSIGQDGKMVAAIAEQNRLIMENTDVQRATLRALKGMGVNVNMDKNGIAVSVMETVEQIQKDKHS